MYPGACSGMRNSYRHLVCLFNSPLFLFFFQSLDPLTNTWNSASDFTRLRVETPKAPLFTYALVLLKPGSKISHAKLLKCSFNATALFAWLQSRVQPAGGLKEAQSGWGHAAFSFPALHKSPAGPLDKMKNLSLQYILLYSPLLTNDWAF